MTKTIQKKSDKGFSIIETLIAILILTFAMMGPLTAVHTSLKVSEGSQDTLTATYLAQEGLDLVRAIRDDNYLAGSSGGWLSGLEACMGGACTIDASVPGASGVATCSNDDCSPQKLYLYNHVYNQQDEGVRTPFVRSVSLTDGDDGHSENISVTVSWVKSGNAHSIVLTDILEDWNSSQGDGNGNAPIVILPAFNLSTCKEITKKGEYTLTSDITAGTGTWSTTWAGTCLNIHDVSNVTIHCENHSITGGEGTILFTNVGAFSLDSCVINPIGNHNVRSVLISNSNNGELSANNIARGEVIVNLSSNLNIHDNTIDSGYGQDYTDHSTIQNNTIPNSGNGTGAASIMSEFGSYNTFSGNTMDGKTPNPAMLSNKTGMDDGITIDDEHNDIVSGNIISNVWDCGIETSGVFTDSVISGNTITNSGICGIGAWYHNSWLRNSVSGNVVSNTPDLFTFYRIWGLRPQGFDPNHVLPADDAVYFKDNSFTNNTFHERTSGLPPGYMYSMEFQMSTPTTAGFIGQVLPTESQMILSGNRFTSNDFGRNFPPFINPYSMVTDGGGNICKPMAGGGYPLVCH